ncbi:2-oxo acid dehydrogenase subunit E2 [Mucilaginibacter daejeonensis]|uniref:dihydrolipoamide acetyltransferase family protein n=1 Tax=Mucilaginibacter daejeonensis TaxID=398049 RepID=UPI001D17311C|nr:dihydrolipoamide acetyltransferase family protein [Mucilaginibacter daejeonensis]UEG51989.1 2-oxo acid dehydrogenase subunit E2 [Mucilaginibacter daejeonensis]
MAKYQLILPKMGESVAEATIINWLKNPGDQIEADDTVVDIATDKVDSEVPSPVSGVLVEQLFKKDDIVQVGEVIAIIETGEAETATPEPEQVKEPETPQQPAEQQGPSSEPEVAETTIPGIDQLPRNEPAKPASVQSSNIRFYSPLVRNIATQEDLTQAELDSIPGTGADGRLTKDDLLGYLANRGDQGGVTTTTPAEPQKAATAPYTLPTPPEAQPVRTSAGDEIIEMDRMRRLIADHMVNSVHTSAHVTSFVEADVTNLVYWREKIKKKFEDREGEKITFTPIFIEAVARAIVDMPMINVSVNGAQIIRKRDINIGMATALPSGNLIVPVIRRADTLNMTGLVKTVNDLAGRARNNQLKPDDTADGTFTVTNIGMFGNIMGTPIINQPQVAILAIGTIKKKPAVLETPTGDVIAIRHMLYLSMSYDHRVVDGALGGMFLKRVGDYLENWDMDREI